MHDGEILLEGEVSKATSGQDADELGGVHGLHVAVLCEAVGAVLVRVENGGEASVHVEGLVVEALEDLAVHVGLESVLCMVGPDYRVSECGGRGGGGGGFDRSDGG